MGGVRGVLLDDSVLLAAVDGNVDGEGSRSSSLTSQAEVLLRRLRYSNLKVGIGYHDDLSVEQAVFLEKIAKLYSFKYISICETSLSDALHQLTIEWSITGEICLYVTSRKESASFDLHNQDWIIACVGMLNPQILSRRILSVENLAALPITICSVSKKALSDKSVIIVGYLMKSSREEDFAKRGAFPMVTTPNGLIFVPLTFEIPLESQIQDIDAVIHKATDEIISIDPHSATDLSKGIIFSRGMTELGRYMQDHPDRCMIDPLINIYPLLDRNKIQKILLGLHDLNGKSQCRVRAPHFLKVDSFVGRDLQGQLAQANLFFPIIVKPQVACGVHDAHNMAIVFKFEDFEDLQVPLPAILQEYVDHGSSIFKFYVLGAKIFYAIKKSMPNSSSLLSSSEKMGSKPIVFNSLKSLPVAPEDQSSTQKLKVHSEALDVELINNSANWLKEQLGLTIFGFDVVIQEGSRDHVIVDLNYLPSFKEVPDVDAIPAFWNAIKNAYELQKAN